MGNKPSSFKGNDHPVEQVSWDDAKVFLRKLSAKTGKKYRLLSESEWEYAARAGSITNYAWGNSASHEYANYGTDKCCGSVVSGRDRWEYTSPVGSFSDNDFGIYDMHGNVFEWVEDCWNGNYMKGPNTEAPLTIGDCSKRVMRGGDWRSVPSNVSASHRVAFTTSSGNSDIGLRVARTSMDQGQVALVVPYPDRTKAIFMALLRDEIWRRNFNLALANGSTDFIKYSSAAHYAETDPGMPFRLANYHIGSKSTLTFGLKNRKIAADGKDSSMNKKASTTLPADHETAKDRIAIYARAINKISDVILKDVKPLESGKSERMEEIVRRVEADF